MRGGKRENSGRKPLPDEIKIRCSPEDHAAWSEAAAAEGKTLSAWVRTTLWREIQSKLGHHLGFVPDEAQR